MRRLVSLAVVALVSSGAAARGGELAAAGEAAQAYARARAQYHGLEADSGRRRFRHHWIKAIAAFQAVGRDDPESPEAAAAQYTIGMLWNELYGISRRPSDLDQALAAYASVAQEHPESALADDALWQGAQLSLRRGDTADAGRALAALLARYPRGDMAARATQAAARLPKPSAGAPGAEPAGRLLGRRDEASVPATVTAVRHLGNRDYSRLVLYLTDAVQVRAPESCPSEGASTLAMRLEHVRLAPGLSVEAADELLSSVSLATDGDDAVLTVMLKAAARPRLAVLESPYRVVVDFLAADAAALPTGLRAPRVVIDPGHGGLDGGARGAAGVAEKDIVLALATEVAAQLTKHGVEVVLTRSTDVFVPLEERTAVANRAAADAFVSIHANSNRKRTASGIETYYLDATDDAVALRMAAQENATGEEQVSDLQLALSELATKVTTRESRALALEVQRRLVGAARRLHPGARDLGAKGSLFYVLLGARMPAVLVETSFISNREEARLLGSARYRKTLAEAIAAGVTARLPRKLPAVSYQLSAEASPGPTAH